MVELQKMTNQLCHALYRNWENDECIYMDMSKYKTYVYNEEFVNEYFNSRQVPSRIMFVIMLGNIPIGELQLKQIDFDNRECVISIHMQNNAVKGKGYGSEAIKMAVKYAFEILGMTVVKADVVIKNARSQHVMKKVGFQFINEVGESRYYRINRKVSV